jgi:hypothetical protein
MTLRTPLLLLAGATLIAPRTLNRLIWGKQAPSDLYEPGMAAWLGTILGEIHEFGR